MSNFDFDDQDSIEELCFKQEVYGSMIKEGKTNISIDSDSIESLVNLYKRSGQSGGQLDLSGSEISIDAAEAFIELLIY